MREYVQKQSSWEVQYRTVAHHGFIMVPSRPQHDPSMTHTQTDIEKAAVSIRQFTYRPSGVNPLRLTCTVSTPSQRQHYGSCSSIIAAQCAQHHCDSTVNHAARSLQHSIPSIAMTALRVMQSHQHSIHTIAMTTICTMQHSRCSGKLAI